MTTIADFTFGEKVASVFDDMLDRSVPFYREIQRMIAEMAADFAVEGTNIYDLGCSTGTTLLNLGQNISGKVKFIGIDYSEDMLARCKQKFVEHQFSQEHELICADLNQGINIGNASVVIMVLTLQFIRPLNREKVIGSILKGLNENGCLILVEKVLGEDSVFNRLFIKYYYDFKKRNGYSELEIAQKREALENVLIPYKLLENRELLLKEGFRYCDVFFKWYNFCGMVAVK
ncbi:MAG: carboxy-S-adenosyl-L-methionine synthase CmoA [Candidatus Brocadia carolinensis]|uniref:Carboxy-S-adenosyl-L-methionine synthase n=1 Tax=Candidatus Brocadia carolinensis TaxID=1004156 RepID=A0A1V4AW88_9BACT|nr:MAG: carboxy-S-adenosyl-L-methionine synthase CmoA [Candidatus Brocadia caroliniensis]